MNTRAEELREEAKAHEQEAYDSFNRCDTDGFLSQWANGVSASRKRKEATLEENNGLAEFPQLFDTDGNIVNAKLIDGKFGPCWAIIGDDGSFTGEFVSAFPARRATLVKKGYLEGYVLRPARVEIEGDMCNATPVFVPADRQGDAPVAIVTTDRFAEEAK